MAATLENIAYAPPQTLREAIQLAWLYSIICGTLEYGRMDVYLGDFYVNDVESGRISEAEALSYLQSIWRLINDLIVEVDGRVIVGGEGVPMKPMQINLPFSQWKRPVRRRTFCLSSPSVLQRHESSRTGKGIRNHC